MTHVRQQIRAAFGARLASVTGVQKVVYVRPHEFGQSELPAIQIMTPSETIAPLDQGDVETYRRIDVDVIAYVLGDEGADNTLDDISAEIETLILNATGSPWDSLVMHFPASASLSIGEAAERTLFALTTRFRVEFSASDPETIGD